MRIYIPRTPLPRVHGLDDPRRTDGRKLWRQMLDRLIFSADSTDRFIETATATARDPAEQYARRQLRTPLKVVNTLTFCVFFFEINYHY